MNKNSVFLVLNEKNIRDSQCYNLDEKTEVEPKLITICDILNYLKQSEEHLLKQNGLVIEEKFIKEQKNITNNTKKTYEEIHLLRTSFSKDIYNLEKVDDIENTICSYVKELSNGTFKLVKEIDLNNSLNSKLKEVYDKNLKIVKEKEKKEAERKRIALEKKKQKEIEKAKLLLKKNGVEN